LRSNVKRSRSLGTKMQKIVFCSYLRQKWIDLRQTKTKMIGGPFYTIAEYIPSEEMLRVSDNL